MQELSLNILDICQNSVKAKAKLIIISIEKSTKQKLLTIKIEDDGCGMTKSQLENAVDPFFTTRKTRTVGLGIPFFKMTAEMTGGSFSIKSDINVGTTVIATYNYMHINMLPLGDIAATIIALISVNSMIEFVYCSKIDDKEFCMNTKEIRGILKGIPLNSNEVLTFIKDFIHENQANIL